MWDFSQMYYFFGMKLYQVKRSIFFSQGKCAWDEFRSCNMETCKASSTLLTVNLKICKNDREKLSNSTIFRSLIGKLIYLIATRPILMFSTYLLLRYMTSSSKVYFEVVRHVLRYLKDNLNFGICFENIGEINLHGYCDND